MFFRIFPYLRQPQVVENGIVTTLKEEGRDPFCSRFFLSVRLPDTRKATWERNLTSDSATARRLRDLREGDRVSLTYREHRGNRTRIRIDHI
jgi:hypothetical protein